MERESRIRPAGDQAILVEFGAEISPQINYQAHEFARRASSPKRPGIGEIIPSYCSALVYYDPFLLSFSQAAFWAEEILGQPSSDLVFSSPVKEVPVLYGGQYGPDLSFVAQHNHITEEEVIKLHTGETYRVYVVGFSPGFSAMGRVPQKIQAPRLATPRTKVPAGSVGIGGLQTGVYAVESPGGWQLIGRTPLSLFDLHKDPPSFFQAGDQARFYPIEEKEFTEIFGRVRKNS